MNSGRIFVALLIIIGAGGAMIKGSPIYSRLLYLGLLLGVASWAWTRWVARTLRVQRHARALRANVGDMFEEHFEVSNNSSLIAPWVEVANESTAPFASGSRLLTLLFGKQKRSYLARTWLTRRGGFPLGPTTLTVGDPFGLFHVTRRFPSTQSLVVLPMLVNIQAFVMPPGLLPGGQVIRRKSADMTPHAAGVREYVHGDAMKRIHWLTSARRGQLMVKEFDQDPQSEVWIFLDAQEKVHVEKQHKQSEVPMEAMLFGRRPTFQLPPSTLEYSATIAASLARYFLLQRRAVGLISAGRGYTVLPAERSERQESKILEMLAFVEARGKLSLAELVATQASQLPQGSSVILITPTVRSDLLAAVDDLQRRNLRPVVVLLDASTFSGERGTEKLAQSLNESRVPVCIIPCDANLSQTLSSFSSQIIYQDVDQWQRPELSHLI
ncbi:MAG: DUF58 domain-containing protein [Chloroflexi bacterium]|nr:DUF58 domain-containing protein [Chloroflexota bacterium]